MPPKRKNKATKTLFPTPPKAPPAAIRTSSQAKRQNGLQGAKPSRLQPSEALHMTTRRAAKTASNHTSSGAPSIASSSSRRSSLNDLAHFEDAHSEIEDGRPTKRSRLSTDSGSPRLSTGSFDQITVNGTQTPDLQKPPSLSVSNGTKNSIKKRRASDASSQSSKTVSVRANGGLTRTQSDISEQQPRRKKRRTTQTLAESADQPPELTDASTAPNSPEPEHIAGVESSQNLRHVLPTNGDAPAKLGRRLPGRRRAPHSDVNVETDLRRQLNLKMSYRSLAKIQKNILEELSSRATSNLENDLEYYKRCPEYEPLMTALGQHRESRLAQVNALRTNKLEQLERVRVATKAIEEEKYIQRFKDLQEDLLLQCFYRMKQIEREVKGKQEAATDDEDNVIAPTHVDFPTLVDDDRLGSKFASRSRAYVETERLLDEDILRKRFDQGRRAFVAGDEDADDSIEEISGGFAAFSGPDRTEAIAHWNILSLVDAAIDIETTPLPPQPPPIIPNEEADALFLLASLSADAPRGAPFEEKKYRSEELPPPSELLRETPPVDPPLPAAEVISSDVDAKPIKVPPVQESLKESAPRPETNGVQQVKEPVPPKNETPARSTHRIMDMLNDDTDIPPPKMREPQPPAYDYVPGVTPSRRVSVNQGVTPLRSGPLALDSIVHRQELPSDLSSTVAPTAPFPPPSDIPPSSPSANRYRSEWPPRLPSYGKSMSEESLRRRDPLNAIRAMLDAKALAEGKMPHGLRPDSSESIRKTTAERDRPQMAVPLLSRPFSPAGSHEKHDVVGKEVRNSNGNAYNASPSAPPLSYNQSPTITSAHPPRHGSQDPSVSQWEHSRRLSGSQAPQPPPPAGYAGSSPQSYHADPNSTGANPPPHHSPYQPSSAPHLPPINSSLQPKPSGPPTTFRFAHYDPAPPRPTYPSPSGVGYPPTSHASNYSSPQQYVPPYSTPPSYHSGYIPPPGSFQAPPPPAPPSATSAMSPYPPLKIHQYGGQPILPASMAPPPSHSQPSTSYASQAAPPPAYSPPQQHSVPPRNSSYELGSGAPRDAQSDRSSEPQSRQRRQYRSYHAPGTQFRSYQGPDAGRRRGG